MKAILLLSTMLLTASSSIAQQHNWLVRGLRDFGHQYKSTFTDLRPHRGKLGWQWPLMVGVLTASAATDWATTCRGMRMSHGQLYETNPLFFHTGSCAQFTAMAIPVHVTELALTHGMTEGFVDICKADASDPNGKWYARKAMPLSYYDPKGCKAIMWVVPVVQIPFNVYNSRRNIDLTRHYEH